MPQDSTAVTPGQTLYAFLTRHGIIPNTDDWDEMAGEGEEDHQYIWDEAAREVLDAHCRVLRRRVKSGATT